VVAGTTMPGIAASRIATTTVPTIVTTTTVFGWFFPQLTGIAG